MNINVPGTYELITIIPIRVAMLPKQLCKVIIEEINENEDTEITNFQYDLSDSLPVQGTQGVGKFMMGLFYGVIPLVIIRTWAGYLFILIPFGF